MNKEIELKKTQTIATISAEILLIVAFCPIVFMIFQLTSGLVLLAILACLMWFILKNIVKIIPDKKLIQYLPLWLIKFYIIVEGYILALIEAYKRDWFKYFVLIFLAVIAISLLKIAFD